jgi:hypothetical protein
MRTDRMFVLVAVIFAVVCAAALMLFNSGMSLR